ncbi:TetR/AcrR family transcriptional regulator [Nocardiopsis ansamitocini]|nr:TetR/AcrR family transcriptional regulator [Nocardiopsis ansamitocini]
MASTDTPGQGTGHEQPVLRADAARNRERIVSAACAVFSQRGLEVAMEDIAREAGVGVATLYRRFPTREALIADAFEHKMTAHADAVADALEDPDPWRGFCGYLERVCAMQAADRGFASVLTLTFPAAKGFEAQRDRAYRGFVELIQRAKNAGRLRADFVAEDLAILLMANAGVVEGTGEAAPETWKRLLGYMIQSFATPAPQPLPDPPSPTLMHRALLRLRPGPRKGCPPRR